MRKNLSARVVWGMIALISAGCAPGLGRELPVSRFPPADRVVPAAVARERVLVRSFSDGRPEHAVAVIDGRPVEPGSDVSSAVRAAMESYLKAAGFRIGGSDSPTLTGTVQRWKVEVTPGFPTTKLEATAALALEVTSPTQEPIFRGTYRGEYAAENPLATEDRIAEALGEAMAAAMSQALADSRLTSALANTAVIR